MFKQMRPFGLFCRLKIKDPDTVRRQLSDLGKKVNSDLRLVFTSKKIGDEIKGAEAKPPLINQ